MAPKNYLPLIISLGILFSINMLMISSLSPGLLGKQLLSWGIGLGLFFAGTQVNPRQIASSKIFVFVISCLLLFTPIALNNITRGSRRWIELGFMSIQPSEFVKPWLMLFLVNTSFPLLILIPFFITLMQPDLGSGLTILLLTTPLILYNKKFFRQVLILLVIGTILSPLVWTQFLHDYQKDRIYHFLSPQSDPLGKGYNVIQSKIAIGSGGIWGKGYRKGTQGQLLFLPEKHTDFMFASTAEELGLIGICIIIGAYFLLVKTLINRAYSLHTHPQLKIFILGITFQIWFTAFINIGMNLGILPVTGIPLPFLSVGGSSLMAMMFSLGIIYS
ncbi:FtsW/RodA/SpoVE family cell cycle protein [Candidatus Shapirobacteria bacterium]|nr:FtsW/RodA/SpoVE family cell cycle protein [Candidatus Shapirobacteria bacterium]